MSSEKVRIHEICEIPVHEVPAIASLPQLEKVMQGTISIDQATNFFANGLTNSSDQEIIDRFTQECCGFIDGNAIATPAVRAHSGFLHIMFTQRNTFDIFPETAQELSKLCPDTVVKIFNAISDAAHFAINNLRTNRISIGAAYGIWKSINPWHLQFVCWDNETLNNARRLPIQHAPENLQGLLHENKRGVETAITFSQITNRDLLQILKKCGFGLNNYTIYSSGTISYSSDLPIWEILKYASIFWPQLEQLSLEAWDRNSSNYYLPENKNAWMNEQKRMGIAIALVHEEVGVDKEKQTKLNIMFGRKMGGYVEGGIHEGEERKTIGGPVEAGGHALERNMNKSERYIQDCLSFHENCFRVLKKVPNYQINHQNYEILLQLKERYN
ncbi:MAG: hypothetical protein NZM26_04590 [Patescibacteria group bacterium]|nr:hypothetical protein [Patescibacteria group bacterium]